MMAFNEQNTVEHFIIHQLTGVNLNAVRGNMVKEDAVEYDTVKWKYTQADLLQRDITEVFVEKELKEALCRLNPDIAANPDRAEEVIHKLRAMLITPCVVFATIIPIAALGVFTKRIRRSE
jgi:type I restriction enzyme, R subunit